MPRRPSLAAQLFRSRTTSDEAASPGPPPRSRRRVELAFLVAALLLASRVFLFVPLPPPSTTRQPVQGGQAFDVYDAFVASRENCAKATVIAQYEGAAARRLEILRAAGARRWPEEREALRQSRRDRGLEECPNCIAASINPRRRVLAATLASTARRPPKAAPIECSFGNSWVRAEALHEVWARWNSTLIVECPVPEALRATACAGALEVSVRAAGFPAAPTPPIRLHVQHPLPGEPFLAACVWTRGDAFLGRQPGWAVGDTRSTGSAADDLRRWIGFHRRVGVQHFSIYDNSAGVHEGTAQGLAAAIQHPSVEFVPWPDEQPLDKIVAAATGGALTAQSFFGRPSQYAAQNSCHRRLEAAGATWVLHVDTDEYAVPALQNETLVDLLHRKELERKKRAAFAMPSLFYALCPAGGVCAGKASTQRGKLIASAKRAKYLWVHYVRWAKGRKQRDRVERLGPSEARLVHVRRGYNFSTVYAARAVAVLDDGDAAHDRRRYKSDVLPRLSGRTTVDCASAPRPPEMPKGVPPNRKIPRWKWVESVRSLAICDVDAPKSWRWCWCRDRDERVADIVL